MIPNRQLDLKTLEYVQDLANSGTFTFIDELYDELVAISEENDGFDDLDLDDATLNELLDILENYDDDDYVGDFVMEIDNIISYQRCN